MRAGRALLALDRYAEARSALDLAHELDPDGFSIRDAREQAGYLLRCHAKEQAALVSRKPQTDLIGIRRGRCKVAGCDCEGYVQKVASHAVLLAGRYVRHDNNPTFFRCLRCPEDMFSLSLKACLAAGDCFFAHFCKMSCIGGPASF